MTSGEVKFAEAIAALRARLESWGVEDPHDKAHAYVTDMVRNGWRATARPVEPQPSRPPTICGPTDEYATARRELLPQRPAKPTDHEESRDE